MPKPEVFSSPESFRSRLTTKAKVFFFFGGGGVKNELVFFAGRKMASKNPKNSGTFFIWSNNDKDKLIDLWSEETIQFALQNSKTSKETSEVYSKLQVSDISYLTQFDNEHFLKDCEVSRLIVDRCKDKFESQIFLYSSLYL